MVFCEYEKEVDALIADQRRLILCTYPLTTSSGAQIFDAASIHQVAVARRRGNWELLETPALKQTKVEIKKLNEELEQKVDERTRELAITNQALRSEIAERRLAEEAVRQAEDRIRLVIDTIPTMAWSLRPDGVLDFLNQRWLDYTGLSLEQAIERPTCTVHPEDLPRVMEKWLVVKDTSEAYEDEMRLRRADGEYRWFLVRIAPFLDEQGNLLKRFGVSIDIEDRKQAELALDERLRFETLLTELSAAFANLPTTAVDQEIDKWLQNLVEFLDLDRAILDQVGEDGITLSRSHSHTARGIDTRPLDVANNQAPWITEQLLRGNTVKWSRIPDDIPEQASKEREFARRIGAKSVLSIPVCIGGSVICAISFTSMRNYGDWSDEMVARLRLVGEIFANAIARKRAEEALFQRQSELSEAQRLASIGSWEWDILTDGLTYSDELRRIYGFGGEDRSSPNKAFSEAIHRDDRVRRNAAMAAALGGGPPYNMEFRIIRPDKSVRFVHSRGQLICDEAGKPLRMIGMAQDITERKRAAKELEKANHQLRFLSRRLFHLQEEERHHLARELHDEVGQALTAAKINLQAAMKETDGAKSKRIDETAAILEKLLGQVRQISVDLRPSTLDDLGLVPALRSLLDQQGRRASVAVHFSAKDVPENLNPEIQTTCFRIAQEAITNALRHANATRIDVDLARENGSLRLRVRDNGRGFDAESAQAQTAGLGLIGIKERAALVDAQAKVVSSPNKGTTVEVSLPLTFPPERESREVGK
jgi:two-component system sensor histidine kinase UhpB